MTEPQPSRRKSDLAEMVEMLLDKGIVVNADVIVSIGDTELLGVHVRAAIASFETAAQYGLEFPEGTDLERVERAAGVQPVERPGDEGEESEEGDAGEESEDGEEEAPQATLTEELELDEDDDGD